MRNLSFNDPSLSEPRSISFSLVAAFSGILYNATPLVSMSQSVNSTISRTKSKALSIARAVLDKKASDVLILEVGTLTSVADYFVFASGESERQVKAIANHVQQEISIGFEAVPQIEGTGGASWILLDYGDIIVHVFRSGVREYYGLEKMWSDAPRLPLPEEGSRLLSPTAQNITGSTLPRAARYGL